MLQRLLQDKTWASLWYEAHNQDFSEILWSEQFSKKRLLRIRDGYEAQNDLDGYSQEYLNRPIAEGNTYFSKDNFLDFDRHDDGRAIIPNLVYYAAADFAISESEKADYTVLMVAGMCPEGFLYVVDVRSGRWDSDAIIDELISVQKAWNPVVFTFETAKIDKALGPFLERRMREERVYLNIDKVTPTKSKTMRGKSIQGMVKSRSVKFDKNTSWYPEVEGQLLTISDSGPRGAHDDFFDAFAWIGLTVHKYYEAQTDEETEEEEYQEELEAFSPMGRSAVTGY